MRIKILTTVFLIIFGAVAYFAYPVFKNRYFQSSESDQIKEESSQKETKSFFNNSSTENSNDQSEDVPEESTVDDNVFIEVNAEDCEDNCEQFEDADDKKYCQEYCGLNTPANTKDDCEKLADLEKDYCWKNKALTEKNFSFCKNITDKKILESCKTRLTDEVINNSNPPIE